MRGFSQALGRQRFPDRVRVAQWLAFKFICAGVDFTLYSPGLANVSSPSQITTQQWGDNTN
jgi:hypothetical protein